MAHGCCLCYLRWKYGTQAPKLHFYNMGACHTIAYIFVVTVFAHQYIGICNFINLLL